MTKLSLIAIAAVFASFAAQAEPLTAPAAPVKVTPVAATTTTAAPTKTGISQQDKMRLCSKQATGKKGAERRVFMKTCLSKKA